MNQVKSLLLNPILNSFKIYLVNANLMSFLLREISQDILVFKEPAFKYFLFFSDFFFDFIHFLQAIIKSLD